MSSYLIAQLGRNYSKEVKYPIMGKMLMNFAIEFYQEMNGFRLFGERVAEGRDGEGHRLLRLLNFYRVI